MPDLFARSALAPFVRLDFPESRILYSDPVQVIETRKPGEVRSCLEQLRGCQAAGFLSYEAGHALEPKIAASGRAAREGEPPLLWFGIFARAEPAPLLPAGDAAWAGAPLPAISFESYAEAVEKIRADIAEGEVYQVNFTFPCSVAVAGDPVALYAQLRERAQAHWSALLFTGTHWLISCSPELFFSASGGRITCRPMKGTAPPSSDPEALRTDPKNRAENLMIVDLMRNDLSRVARPGTVEVPRLFEVERYPTLLQMTSTVTAEIVQGRDAIDVLETIFPCGSITGAPKIAAMERIDALERPASYGRGPYTGSIGHLRENGDAAFNVAIRTLVLEHGATSARYDVGSAIVIDSDALCEWRECLQKAAFVSSDRQLALIETFALGPDQSPLVVRHIERLERSARALGFLFDRSALESELARIRAHLPSPVRARLSLARSGAFEIEQSPMPRRPPSEVEVALVQHRVSADDFRLYHKTSDRSFYDAPREAAGRFEVLFTDEHGFLTEGSFTNLFVRKGERLVTPPLSRGLLPGILRQHLIETGAAIEGDLRPADLEAGFFIGNSLRGLIPARLDEKTIGQAREHGSAVATRRDRAAKARPSLRQPARG